MKKLLVTMLSVVMVITMMPATAMAEVAESTVEIMETVAEAVDTGANAYTDIQSAASTGEQCNDENCLHEAKIGELHYSTVEEAIEAVPADGKAVTVEIIKDKKVKVENQIHIKKGQNVILKFNADTEITYTGSNVLASGVVLVHNGASLTIKCIWTQYGIKSGDNAYAAVALTANGDDFSKPAKLTVNGGLLEGKYYGIVGNGSRNNTEIVINGGKIKGTASDDNAGIYHPQNGILTINGGTVEGATGIYFKSGELTIGRLSKINGKGSKVPFEHNSSGFNSTGDALVIEACDFPGGVPVVLSINGGTFESTNGQAVAYYEAGDFHLENTKFITGGIFSSDPSAYVNDKFICQQMGSTQFKVNSNDDFVAEIPGRLKFEKFVEALEYASTDGTETEIRLLKDIALNQKVSINDKKNIKLNLNGFNIKSSSSCMFDVENARFHITGNGVLGAKKTKKGNLIEAKGAINNCENYTVISIDKDVTLRAYDTGIFVKKDESSLANSFGVVINMNGTIEAESIGITITGAITNSESNVNKINMDGATIVGTKMPIYASGYAEWNLKDCNLEGNLAAIEIRAGKLTIDGGRYVSTADEFSCDPNSNGSTTSGAALAVSTHTTKKNIEVTINNGYFKGIKALNESNPQKNNPNPIVKLDIRNGNFDGDVDAENVKKFVSGGYYTSDITEYLADGKIIIPSTDASYKYMVADEKDANAKPAVGAPAIDGTNLPDEMTEEHRKAVMDAAASVEPTGSELIAAANVAVGEVTEKQVEDAKEAYKNSGITGSDSILTENIHIYAQTYLQIKPIDYRVGTDGSDAVLKLDIEPMYRVVASAEIDASKLNVKEKVKNGDEANAVVLEGSEKPLDNIKQMTISIELPTYFLTGNLKVKHHSDSGVYYYRTDVKSDKATFTVTHGFSIFEFLVDSRTVTVIFNDNEQTLKPENVGDTFPTATAQDGKTFEGWKFEGIDGIFTTLTDDLLSKLSLKFSTTSQPIKAEPKFKDIQTGGGYFPTTPTIQKPVIEIFTEYDTTKDGAKVTLSADGTSITIEVLDGYELTDVTINGVSKGAVTKVTGLKTGDKVIVLTKKLIDEKEARIAKAKATKLIARSQAVKIKSGKKAIKVYWFAKEGSLKNLDGVQIFRSTKRADGTYKKVFTSKSGKYINTAVKKGQMYYYKVRGYVRIDGKLYFTKYSTKAWRRV